MAVADAGFLRRAGFACMTRWFRRLRKSIAENRLSLVDEHALLESIALLQRNGELSGEAADALSARIGPIRHRSEYILKHLGAHLGIGAVFAFDVIPLPLGTIARVTWVAGSRVYETFWGTRERARVHSIGVLLIAAIPFGYWAYLVPLRRRSEAGAYLFANRLAFTYAECSYARLLEQRARWVQGLGRRLVPTDPAGALASLDELDREAAAAPSPRPGVSG